MITGYRGSLDWNLPGEVLLALYAVRSIGRQRWPDLWTAAGCGGMV